MRFLVACAALLATALAGCSGAEKGEIHLYDDRFEVAEKPLAAGAAIEFENEGARKHNVSIHKAGEPADSLRLHQDLEHAQSTKFTFQQAGTYHVWCKYHGGMTSGMAMVVTVT